MAQVTNVAVSYDRKRQPANYESAGASVSFSVVIGEGEDHVAVAAKVLGEAKTLVLTELGIVKPGESASASARAASGDAGNGSAGAGAGSQQPAGAGKPPTKAEQKAAAKAAAEASANASEGRQISQNPEDRKPPADDDIPGDEKKPPAKADSPDTGGKVVTYEELHAFIAESIKRKTLDHATVKKVSASKQFSVARIAELKVEQLGPYLEALKAEMKAASANSDMDGL